MRIPALRSPAFICRPQRRHARPAHAARAPSAPRPPCRRYIRGLHICRNFMQGNGAAGPSFLRKIMFFVGAGKSFAGTDRGSRDTKTGFVATGIGAVAAACTSRSAGMYTFRFRNPLIINSSQKQRRHAAGVCLLCDTKIRKKEAVCKCAHICPRLSFCIFMRLICGFVSPRHALSEAFVR